MLTERVKEQDHKSRETAGLHPHSMSWERLVHEKSVRHDRMKESWHMGIICGPLSVNFPFLLCIPGEQIDIAF